MAGGFMNQSLNALAESIIQIRLKNNLCNIDISFLKTQVRKS